MLCLFPTPESEREIVESLTFSLSKQREAFSVQSQEDMNTDRTPQKTPPASRRKIRGMEYGGEHRSSTLDKVVVAKMEHYLD